MDKKQPKLERPLWDLDRPQPEIIQLVDEGWIKGATLDVACGTGENALHVSGFGFPALGLDSSQPMLRIAREKSQLMQARRGMCARFKPGRPHQLLNLGEIFETIYDFGLYQTLPANIQVEYIDSLDKIIQPDGHYILFQFAPGEYELELCKKESSTTLGRVGWRPVIDRAAKIELQNGRMASAWLQVFAR
jgi:SAM-dependent methyltransferase